MTTTQYPIHQYLNTQQAYDAAFTANNQSILFTADITGIAQLWRTPADDQLAWPEQLTFGTNRILAFYPSPHDANLVIYAMDSGGNENAQLWLLDADAGIHTPLTTGYENAMHLPGCWKSDGSRFYCGANRRHPGRFDLISVGLDGSTETIWEQEEAGYLFEVAVLENAGKLLTRIHINGSSDKVFIVDEDSKTATCILGNDPTARFSALNPLPDGNRLLLITDLNRDYDYVATYDLTSKEIKPYLMAGWDIEALSLAPSGESFLYAVNENGATRLLHCELATKEMRAVPMLEAEVGVLGIGNKPKFSPDGSSIVFTFANSNHPANLYIWDVPTADGIPSQPIAKTMMPAGGIPEELYIAPEHIHFPTFDHREIPAWLYRPNVSDSEARPAIVIVHGGPEGQSRPGFSFLVQYFVHQGYVVMVPNVRGSTGYGKAYSHLDDVEKRMDSVEDLGFAAKWLAEQPGVDPEKLVVFGGSYGGFMVLSTLTTHPDLWAAGINIVGISNFVTFLENTSDYRRAHREAEYGSLAENREFLESISPMNHLDQLQAPLMVIHGANDPRVPLSEAEQLVEFLQARKHPVELLVFGNEGHGIKRLENKIVLYPAIIDFLKTYL